METRLFINNEFVPAQSGETFDLYNPATEEFVASVSMAGIEDVNTAVQAAKDAFPGWSALAASERGQYLFKLADALEQKMEQITYLEAVTMGKPISLAWLDRSGLNTLRYFAGKARDIQGDTSLSTPGFINMCLRQPYGVCGAIIPWNVPFLMVINKIAPSLVSGNTLVMKTSEKAPLSCLVVAECCKEIGLPKGVFNLVHGYGKPTGDAIARHMDIRKVSFTGSQATGRAIKIAAAQSNLKNVTLELGGKSPLLVFDDADLAKAASAAAKSILLNNGQGCFASSRIYVHEDIMNDFVTMFRHNIKEQAVTGDPLSARTRLGPLADKAQAGRVKQFIAKAKEDGLCIAPCGQQDEEQTTAGDCFVEPAIVFDAPEDSRVIKEEIFGPVVCVNKFSTEEQVLRLANDTEYGLYASVFTRDVSLALRVAKGFEAGSVGINCTSPMQTVDMPFGGHKGSGDGYDYSKYALDDWTQLKAVYIDLGEAVQ